MSVSLEFIQTKTTFKKTTTTTKKRFPFFYFFSLNLPSIHPDHGSRSQPCWTSAALPHQTFSVWHPTVCRAAVQHNAGPSAESSRRGRAEDWGQEESAGQPHVRPLQNQGEWSGWESAEVEHMGLILGPINRQVDGKQTSSVLVSIFQLQVTTGELPSPPSSLSIPSVLTPPSLSPPVPSTLPALTSLPEPQAVAPMVTRTAQRQSSAGPGTGTFVCQVWHRCTSICAHLKHSNFFFREINTNMKVWCNKRASQYCLMWIRWLFLIVC